MNHAFAINKLLLMMIIAALAVCAAQYLDRQHQSNMQAKPHVILDDFLQ